ncbi:MAG: HYR domain-containing protein, partial [Saprospiraceae bacterium]|nr:HYR domain-containing protein [Saprospiraceae bacterium]
LPSGSDFPLGATNVVFTATDPSGNTGTCNFTVQVDESFIVTTNVSEPTCAGLCNGSISLNINGPGAPFTIQWSNGNTTPSLTALCAGDYSATITDITGCSAVFSFILGAPDALSIGIDDVDQDINDQGIGAISVTVSGGTPAYTFNWLRNGAPFASTEDLTGLHIGTYQLILTDANGCSLSGPSIVIINNISDAAEPDFLAGWVLAPNPASDQTVLRFTQALPEQVGMFLYDASGRLIRNERIAQGTEQFTIDLSDLPAGMMQLRLLGESGSLSTKTLIKIK